VIPKPANHIILKVQNRLPSPNERRALPSNLPVPERGELDPDQRRKFFLSQQAKPLAE
jgi:hypothetical protein